MTPKHVLIISYHFSPSAAVGARRPTELAKRLAADGFHVSILRGCDRSHTDIDIAELGDTVEVYTVKFPRKPVSAWWRKIKSSIGKRTRSSNSLHTDNGNAGGDNVAIVVREASWPRRQVRAWLSFIQGDKLWLIKAIGSLLRVPRTTKYDVVIATGPPIAGYLAGVFASKRFKAPLILDFRDPWYLNSDPRLRSLFSAHPLALLEDNFGQMCVSHSTGITVASPGTAKHIDDTYALKGQSVDVILNGYDSAAICTTPAPTGRLDLVYAGTLYLNRNPFPFLRAIRTFVDDPNIARDKVQFTLVGDCNNWNGIELLPWLEEQSLCDVVNIRAAISPPELNRLISSSNVLVNFAQGQSLQIPAKSYEYLVAGRDLILIAETDSDVARLYENAGVGYVIAPEEAEEAAPVLAILYDAYVVQETGYLPNSRNTDEFSRAFQLQKFEQIIDSIASTPGQ